MNLSRRAARPLLMMSTDALPDKAPRLDKPLSLKAMPSKYVFSFPRSLFIPLTSLVQHHDLTLIVHGAPFTASRLPPSAKVHLLRKNPISFTLHPRKQAPKIIRGSGLSVIRNNTIQHEMEIWRALKTLSRRKGQYIL